MSRYCVLLGSLFKSRLCKIRVSRLNTLYMALSMAMVDWRLLNSRGEARVKGQCSRAVLACFSLIAFMSHIRSGSWVTFERNVITLVHKIPLPSGYCALPALSPTPTHPVIRDNKISTDIVYKYFLPLMYPSWDIRVQGWKFIKLARITQESNKPVCLAANWKKILFM